MADLIAPDACRTITAPPELFLYISYALEELAKSSNWEQYGTATVDETADAFKEISDNWQISSCQGGQQMESIPVVNYNLFSDYNMTTNIMRGVVISGLSYGADEASALYCTMEIYATKAGTYFWVTDGNYARQVLRAVPGVTTVFPIVVPVNNGTATFRSFVAAGGDTWSWSVNLIGYWL